MDSKGLPTKLVEFMSAPSPDIVLESHTLVHNPEDEKQTCGNGMLTFECLGKYLCIAYIECILLNYLYFS